MLHWNGACTSVQVQHYHQAGCLIPPSFPLNLTWSDIPGENLVEIWQGNFSAFDWKKKSVPYFHCEYGHATGHQEGAQVLLEWVLYSVYERSHKHYCHHFSSRVSPHSYPGRTKCYKTRFKFSHRDLCDTWNHLGRLRQHLSFCTISTQRGNNARSVTGVQSILFVAHTEGLI